MSTVWANNVAFGTHGYTLDFAYPNPWDGVTTYPGVILLHGTGGDKADMHTYAEDLIGRGYICACANYNEDVTQGQNDLSEAIQWLKGRSRSNGKVGALGGSRGAIISFGAALSGMAELLAAAGWSGSAGAPPVPQCNVNAKPIYCAHGTLDNQVGWSECGNTQGGQWSVSLKKRYNQAPAHTMTLDSPVTNKHGLQLANTFPEYKTAAYDWLDTYVK